MKKALLILASAAALICACEKYDDSALKEQIAALEKKVTDLQSALQSATEKSLTVTVTAVEGGNKLTFSDGTSVIVLNGAAGATGAQGPQGPAGKDGSDATVTITDNGDSYTFKVGEKEYTIKKTLEFSIILETTTPQIAAGESAVIKYTLTGADASTVVIANTTGGYTASIDSEAATLTIKAPAELPETGSVLLMAISNATSRYAAQYISFANGVISPVADIEVPAAGGPVSVVFDTNCDDENLEIVIPEDCDWVTFADTKALHQVTKGFIVSESKLMKPRTAVITIKGANVEAEFAIVQGYAALPTETKAFGVDMGQGYGGGDQGTHCMVRVPICHTYCENYDFTKFEAFTLECWVKFNNQTPWGDSSPEKKNWLNTVMGNPGYAFIRVNHPDDAGGVNVPTKAKFNGLVPGGEVNSQEFTLNEWHHVALTYDKGVTTIYVDGEIGEQNTFAAQTVDLTQVGEGISHRSPYYDFFLGTQNQSRFLNGSMAEARLWTVARTQAQIKDSAKHLSAREAGLLGYWKLAGTDNATILQDYSGNGFDAEILGDNDFTEKNVEVTNSIPKAYGLDFGEGYGWGGEGSHATLRFSIHNENAEKGYAYSTKYDFTAMSQVTLECLVKFNHSIPWGDAPGKNFLNQIMGNPDYFGMRLNHSNGDENTAPTKAKVNCQIPGCELNSCEIDLSKWHHVALTFNDGTAKVYVDGTLCESNANCDKTIDLTKSNIGESKYYDFFLGCYNQGRWLNGSMAEARVWSVERTADQLAANAYSVDATTEGLVAYWKLRGTTWAEICADYTTNDFDLEHLNANPIVAANVPVIID